MIHGPENKGNLNLLYNIVSKGIPWPLGNFKNERSYLSIENLCFIIKELIQRQDIPSGVYNVADDIPLSTNEIVKLIAESKGKKARFLHLNKTLIIYLARLGDLLKLPLNSERLKKLTENYVVSNAKIKLALGKPLPVSSKEGLIKTLKSFSNRV
jgi:nucleoside-diphosphate-sugar epimerase